MERGKEIVAASIHKVIRFKSRVEYEKYLTKLGASRKDYRINGVEVEEKTQIILDVDEQYNDCTLIERKDENE